MIFRGLEIKWETIQLTHFPPSHTLSHIPNAFYRVEADIHPTEIQSVYVENSKAFVRGAGHQY